MKNTSKQGIKNTPWAGWIMPGAIAAAIVVSSAAAQDAAPPKTPAAANTGTSTTAETKENAPTTDRSKEPLAKVKVVGTPVIEGNKVNNLGSEVTTVGRGQIDELNAQNLQDALRETPGVVVSHFDPIGSFGGGEGGSVFIRGMGVSRPGAEIQLDIDGIPIYNSIWTHPLLDMFSVDIAQRIDIYKGAQPVLYGNMAFGVVDLITKRQTESGFSTSLQMAGGSYNTLVEVVENGGKVDNFDYYLLQSYRSSDGDRVHSNGELQNYFGRVGYALNSNWEVHVVLNRTDNWANDPGPLPGLVPPSQAYNNGTFYDYDDLAITTLANHFENADGYIKAYWNSGQLNWVNQFNSGSNDENTLTRYDNYGVKTRETFRPWTGAELMTGVDVDFISGQYTDAINGVYDSVFPRETFKIVSPYAAVSQRFELNTDVYLQPSAGFRYFHHSEFADEVAPQAGLVFGIKSTEFHASYARGVNYPGIFVEAYPLVNSATNTLHAETVDHYEIGASQRINKIAKLDLTLFYDGGSNRIVMTTPPFYPLGWENIGSYRTKGIETVLTVTPVKNLALYGGFTVLDPSPSDLPYAPNWTASAGVTYQFLKHFKLSVDSQYVGKQITVTQNRALGVINNQWVGDYFVVNTRLSYDFAWPVAKWQFKGQVFVAGQNLTNALYEQTYGYPMPRINFMGGVRISF
jgi:outer membrane cobalamin receptor